MKRKYNLLFYILIFSFLLGILFTNLFINHYWGINIFLMTITTVILTLILKFKFKGKLELIDLLYIPILIISFFPTWHQDQNLIVMDILFLIFSFSPISYLSFHSKRIQDFTFINLFIAQIISIFSGLIGAIPFLKSFITLISSKSNKNVKILNSKLIINIIIGIIITMPIFVIFLVLFIHSDDAFSQILKNLHIRFSISQIITMIMIAFLFIYIFIGLIFSKAHPIIENNTNRSNRLNAIIGIILLVSINFLFLTFIIVQLVYLFGDHEKVVKLGLTYSEYARKGFWELQIVSTLSLLLLYAIKYLFNFKTFLYKYIFIFLTNLYIINVLIILFSAHTRMSLYEEGYGYTHLRLYTHVFMIFEAGIFLYFFIDTLINKKLMPYFATFTYFYGILIFSTLNLLRPDAYIATHNINRYKTLNKSLDIKYILTLSNEATVKLNDIDFMTKDLYLCEIRSLNENSKNTYDSFKEYNISRINNSKKIEQLTQDLNDDKCFNIASKYTEKFLNDYLNTAKNQDISKLTKYYENNLTYNDILIKNGEKLAKDIKNASDCSIDISTNRSMYTYEWNNNKTSNTYLFFSDFPYYVTATIQCQIEGKYRNYYKISSKDYKLYFTINKKREIKIQSIDSDNSNMLKDFRNIL